MSVYNVLYKIARFASHSEAVKQSPLFSIGVVALMALPLVNNPPDLSSKVTEPKEFKQKKALPNTPQDKDTLQVWEVLAAKIGHPGFVKEGEDVDRAFTNWAIRNKAELQEITDLDLSGLGLKSLPHQIGFLTNLASLSLRDNYLKDLPRELTNCSKLEVLNINNNRMNKTPSCLETLSKTCVVFSSFIPSKTEELQPKQF